MRTIKTRLLKDSWTRVAQSSTTFDHIKGMCISAQEFASQKSALEGKAGIYFFIWVDGATGNFQKVYIGETENLAVRPLQKHGSMPLDWHFLAVFFREHDKERYFDTDSRQYMEQALIDRFPYPDILLNGNGGHKRKKLTDEKQDVCDTLTDEIVDMAPALCFGLFVDFRYLAGGSSPDLVSLVSQGGSPDPTPSTDTFFFESKKRGTEGKAKIGVHMGHTKKRDTVLLAGSVVSSEVADNFARSGTIKAMRAELEAKGILVNRVLQQDYLFTSQSGAGQFLNGTTFDGNSSWKNKDGTPLKELL